MNDTFNPTNIRPVFVVGYSRSGTTLLQLLIAAHAGFRTGRETHLFKHALVPISNWISGFISTKELDLVLDRLSRKSELALDMVARDRLYKEAQSATGLRVTRLMHETMLHLAGKPDDRGFRWVEKSPRHAMYIPEILNLFPKANIINIVRDPRDVVSSRIKMRDFSNHLKEFTYYLMRAEEWRVYVEKSLSFAAGSDRVMTVRYENLAANPSETMTDVMTFLGERFEPESLETFAEQYANVILPWEHRHKNLCAKGTIVNRAGIWRERITPAQARMVEHLCTKLMDRFKYEPQKPTNKLGVAAYNSLVQCCHFKRKNKMTLKQLTRKASGYSFFKKARKVA